MAAATIAWRNRGHRGPFGYYSYYNFAAVADGLSNTLAFSEKGLRPGGGHNANSTRKVKLEMLMTSPTSSSDTAAYSFALTDGSTHPAYLSDRTLCSGMIGSDGMYISGGYANSMGWNYVNGSYQMTSFVTTLPPNSASCYLNAGFYNALVSASSYHSGGVNVTLLDGAVRFISETIDAGTGKCFADVATDPVGEVSGESPFGVWGAYGSRDGGEAKSL